MKLNGCSYLLSLPKKEYNFNNNNEEVCPIL